MTKRPDWKNPVMHSIPQEMAIGWSPRAPGRNFQHYGSLISEDSSQDSGSQLFRKKRLSTVEDLESSSGQVEPRSDHLAAEEEPCMSASLDKIQRQKIENLQEMSWPRNAGMPGISDATCQRRRNPKKRAAAVGLLPPIPALSMGSSRSRCTSQQRGLGVIYLPSLKWPQA